MSILRLVADQKDYFVRHLSEALRLGTIEIRDGIMPSDPSLAATGNLLVTLHFSYPALNEPVNGIATTSTISSGDAVYTSTATWARFKGELGGTVFDTDVTDTSGNGALKLASVDITNGMTVQLTSFHLGFGSE